MCKPCYGEKAIFGQGTVLNCSKFLNYEQLKNAWPWMFCPTCKSVTKQLHTSIMEIYIDREHYHGSV